MFHLRTILMVLIGIRMLMPPGICVCKWNSPAARFLVALWQSDRQVPVEEERDDDHAPGCPASPLAVGMGVKPPSEPLLPPDLSLDLPPPPESAQLFSSTWTETTDFVRFDHAHSPLYLTLRALLI
jgi:hypothetical protein